MEQKVHTTFKALRVEQSSTSATTKQSPQQVEYSTVESKYMGCGSRQVVERVQQSLVGVGKPRGGSVFSFLATGGALQSSALTENVLTYSITEHWRTVCAVLVERVSPPFTKHVTPAAIWPSGPKQDCLGQPVAGKASGYKHCGV